MESLSDRLKSLGFKTAATVDSVSKPTNKRLEEIIAADIVSNSLGSFLIRSDSYPYGYQHGNIIFSDAVISEKINQAAKLPSSGIPLSSLIFLDTETSGLSGGTGTFAFLVGIGVFNDRGFDLKQLVIRDPSEESAMLLHLMNLVQPDSVFVTFNGKSFDIPLLQNRLIVNRLPANFRGNPHIDVLHLSRKLWRNQLPSCSLKDLEVDILSMQRSDEEVPGWMIPEIYFEYLRTGAAERLGNVIYHNAQDIVSLAALFIHISTLLEQNADLEGFSAGDLIAVGKIFQEMGSSEVAERVFLKCLDYPLSKENCIIVNNLMGKLHKVNNRVSNSVQFWVNAGNAGNYEACIELAMFYEHQVRDLQTALEWTEKAAKILDGMPEMQFKNRQKSETYKRLDRLHTKASK